MTDIIILSGSPSRKSRSLLAAAYAGELAKQQGYTAEVISITDFKPEDLVYARFDSPAIVEAGKAIETAKGLIIASPVYKASYTGVLKALLDVLPQGAFTNKPVLPIMTGGSPAHLLAIDYALKPLIANLKGESLQGVYICDQHILKDNPTEPITEKETAARLREQSNHLLEAIRRNDAVSLVK
ncbi:NADPH-dependent FMN reductase [Terribacillus sp. DMT04]|uniref:NADPH-dependent FMN reductase n=1 Tax=Terribacillus sp. DMT04 TaxID=2850441 RepID=UPI001C2BCCBE|nr:NADPH-dependent FMN reductase [Terribacillus sp. DMT04]QXE03009.1 NADPH-dependent FMN reductase [Terribacillus sp. DMT04]